jgi:hypothetical protein
VDTKEYIFDNFMQFDSLDVVAGNDDGQRKLRMVLRLIDRKKSDTNAPVVMQTIKVGYIDCSKDSWEVCITRG